MSMKVLQINAVYKNGGSTGRIVHDLKNIMSENGIDSYVAFGYEYQRTHDKNTYKIESIPELKFSILETRMFGRHGFYNIGSTKKLIRWISDIKPDLIHLHNLHCHYMNVDILFNYIKEQKIPVVWTLHDCWSFTGWCAHFDYIGCEKWKTGCYECENIKEYPFTWFFDRSEENYDRKKHIFQGVNNLTIVTPSAWLKKKVGESYLKNYPVEVINNGIDLSIFHPVESKIKEEIGVGNKKMVLAMAMGMSKLKGYDYIIKAANDLSKQATFVICGLEEKQIHRLPKGVIGLTKTNDAKYLAKLYSAADVFINPTLQDTFPTTNLESIACGTPVITFNTGGSPESIFEGCGIVVEKEDIDGLENAIVSILQSGVNTEKCVECAKAYFDKRNCFRKYINLYHKVIRE